jgi:hypothetical protein
MDEPGQALRQRLIRIPRREVRRHSRFGQIRQWELLTLPMPLEFLHDCTQGMRAHEHVHRPIGPNDQQPCLLPTPGHTGEQLQRGRITPVQIFQHQDEWPRGGQRFHGLGQLPQHPLVRRPEPPPLERVELGRTEEGGHLHQPARGILAQERYEALACRPPTQPSEGLQHWQISVSNPILFDALPVTDPQRFLALRPRYEGLHQGGLANARLARHEGDLPLALHRFGPPPLHLGALHLPPNQQRRGSGGDEGRGSGRESVGDSDRRHEPVPSAVHGLDAPRRPWMVPHRLANLAYTHRQRRLTHMGLGPHDLQKFVFGHQLPRMLCQVAQDSKRLVRQVERLRPTPQPLVSHVETKGLEDQNTLFWHGSPSHLACTVHTRVMPSTSQ